MRDTIGGQKRGQGDVLTTIVGVQSFDGGVKVFFHNSLESYEGFFDIRFVFEWVEPDVLCEVIDEENIVFKAISRVNERGPYIRKDYFKRLSRDNCRGGQRQFVAFVAETSIT